MRTADGHEGAGRGGDRPRSLAEGRVDLLVLSCAASAGVHGALAPGHVGDGVGAGLGFAAAAVVLAGLVLRLTRRPVSGAAIGAAAATLAGLLTGYALAITTGVPVLHPDPEPVAALALATKAIEAAGLLAATSLLWRPAAVTSTRPKGMPS